MKLLFVEVVLAFEALVNRSVEDNIIKQQYDHCNIVYFDKADQDLIKELTNIFKTEQLQFHAVQGDSLSWKNKKLEFESSALQNVPFQYTGDDILVFKRQKKNRNCLLTPPNEARPKANLIRVPVEMDLRKKVEFVVPHVNQLCNFYRDYFGRKDPQGLHHASIQRNLYRPDQDPKLTENGEINEKYKMQNIKFKREKHKWEAYDRSGEKVDLPQCKRKSFADLTEDEFRHEYLERNQPLIITNAIDHWEALKTWDKSFFSTNFGPETLHVKLGQNGIFEGPERRDKWEDHINNQLPAFIKEKLQFPDLVMERPGGVELTVDQILKMFQNETRDPETDEWISAYIEYTPMSTVFKDLKQSLQEPGFEKNLFSDLELKHSNIWIGDGQTLGKLHFDEFENALAVVKGVKEVILFDPRSNMNLYEGHIPEARFKVTNENETFKLARTGLLDSTSMVMSPVNILSPDFNEFPSFGEAIPIQCRIEEGEFLFLPSFWWHEVQSYPDKTDKINVAVNFWFRPFFEKEFPCSHCPLEINPFYRHLL